MASQANTSEDQIKVNGEMGAEVPEENVDGVKSSKKYVHQDSVLH